MASQAQAEVQEFRKKLQTQVIFTMFVWTLVLALVLRVKNRLQEIWTLGTTKDRDHYMLF